MNLTATIEDAELKQIIRDAVVSKFPGYAAMDVSIEKRDNQRNADTFRASVRLVTSVLDGGVISSGSTSAKSLEMLVNGPDTTKGTAELRDWYEVLGMYYGNIYNDSKGRFSDGDSIRTSSGVIHGNKLVTRNTIYTLGNKAGQKDIK